MLLHEPAGRSAEMQLQRLGRSVCIEWGVEPIAMLEVGVFATERAAWDAQTDWRTGRWQPRTAPRTRAAWQAPDPPGVLSKRPMGFGESLDAGFRLLRFAPGASVGTALIGLSLLALGLAALIAGIVWLTFGYLAGVMDNPDAFGGLSVLMQLGAGFASLLTLCFLHLISGFLVLPAADAFFTPPGERPRTAAGASRITLPAVWQRLAGRRVRLFGATALLGCAHLLAALVLVAPGAALIAFGQPVLGGIALALGVLGWLGLTVVGGVRTAFVGCAIAYEGLSVRAAFARSWQLTGRGFWSATGLLLLAYFLSSQLISIIISPLLTVIFIAYVIIALTVGTAEGAESLDIVFGTVFAVLVIALTAAASAVLFAYVAGVMAGLYFDRRMRFEGYDLILLRAAESPADSPPEAPADSPAESPAEAPAQEAR